MIFVPPGASHWKGHRAGGHMRKHVELAIGWPDRLQQMADFCSCFANCTAACMFEQRL